MHWDNAGAKTESRKESQVSEDGVREPLQLRCVENGNAVQGAKKDGEAGGEIGDAAPVIKQTGSLSLSPSQLIYNMLPRFPNVRYSNDNSMRTAVGYLI